LKVLAFAKKHPEGFTLGELCQKSKVDKNLCKKLRTEFIHSGVFSQLNETRDDSEGEQQRVYTLSFSGRSQLLAQEMNSQTKMIGFLTAVMIGLVFAQVIIAQQQVYYAEVQSRGERIYQAQVEQRAIEFCNENPDAEDSGLNYTDGDKKGEIAPCSVILEKYGN
jgi:hypothetical protein